MAWNIQYLPSVPSTNDYLLEKGHGLPLQTLVWTQDQTRGRGRLGRTWVAVPNGALAFSMLLPLTAGVPAHHSQVGALSMAQALRLLQIPVLLKWPNDLRMRGAKLGGVLAEARQDRLVLGIGLNLRDPDGRLTGLDQKATCLERAGVGVPDPLEIFHQFLPLFDRNLAACDAGGFSAIHESWRDLAEEGGRTAMLRRTPDAPLEPVWVGPVQPDGRLQVRHGDGRHEILASGDLLYE